MSTFMKESIDALYRYKPHNEGWPLGQCWLQLHDGFILCFTFPNIESKNSFQSKVSWLGGFEHLKFERPDFFGFGVLLVIMEKGLVAVQRNPYLQPKK
jgi:hypothetical protein